MVGTLGRWSAFATVGLWSSGAAAQASASFPEDKPATAPAPAATPPPAATPAPTPLPPPPPPPAAQPAQPPPPPPAAAAPAPVAPAEPPPPTYPTPIEPPIPEERIKPDHRVSLTFSPLHLFGPIFELEVEVMPTPHLGLAAIGGIGSVTVESTDPGISDQKFSAWELGAQVTGYPLGDFSSLQLGAELLYLHIDTSDFQGAQVSASGAGLAIGPFVGYKLITDVGFTLFIQGGFEYLAVKAEAHDDAGNMASDEQSAFIPLLNLNAGWSF